MHSNRYISFCEALFNSSWFMGGKRCWPLCTVLFVLDNSKPNVHHMQTVCVVTNMSIFIKHHLTEINLWWKNYLDIYVNYISLLTIPNQSWTTCTLRALWRDVKLCLIAATLWRNNYFVLSVSCPWLCTALNQMWEVCIQCVFCGSAGSLWSFF